MSNVIFLACISTDILYRMHIMYISRFFMFNQIV